MKPPAITRKQASAAVTAALLSPLMRQLPGFAAAAAGRGAWLTVLPAVPLLLALAALLRSLRRSLMPGEGLAALFPRFFGPRAGGIILSVFGLWFLVYAGFVLRSGADRLADAVYLQSRPEPFMAVLLALALLGSLGALRAVARAAVILRAALIAVLSFVAAAALPGISLSNLFPLYPRDLPRLLPGAVSFASVGGAAAAFSFLAGSGPSPEEGRGRLAPLWTLAAAAALLCFETVGCFGPTLTARLTYPFFTLSRDISLFHLTQRVEAAVIALWVWSDVLLTALLLRCAHEVVRTVFSLPPPEEAPFFSLRRGRWLLWAEAGTALFTGFLIAPSAGALRLWTGTIVPLASDILVFGGLPLLWLAGRLRKMI